MSGDDLVDDPPEEDVQYIARTLKIPVEEARRFVENQNAEGDT